VAFISNAGDIAGIWDKFESRSLSSVHRLLGEPPKDLVSTGRGLLDQLEPPGTCATV